MAQPDNKLSALQNAIATSPTIMDITQEIVLMNMAMSIPLREIRENPEAFLHAIGELHLSHSGGGYFELTAENEGKFLAFTAWLEPVLAEIDAAPSLRENLLDTFRMTKADVDRAYGKG